MVTWEILIDNSAGRQNNEVLHVAGTIRHWIKGWVEITDDETGKVVFTAPDERVVYIVPKPVPPTTGAA